MSKKLQKIENHLTLDFTNTQHGYQLFSRIPTSTTSSKKKLQNSSISKQSFEISIPLRNEKLVESLGKQVHTEQEFDDLATKTLSTMKSLNANNFKRKSKEINFPEIFSRPQTASTDGFLKIRKISLHQPRDEAEKKPQKYFQPPKSLSKPEKPKESHVLSTTANVLSNETQNTEPLFDHRRSTINNTDIQPFGEEIQKQELKTNQSLVPFEKNLSPASDQHVTEAKFFEVTAGLQRAKGNVAFKITIPGQRPSTATYPKTIKENQNESEIQAVRSFRGEELVGKLVDMQILRNNQNISKEKIHLTKSNSSVRAHLQTLTTTNSVRSSQRLLSAQSNRPVSSKSLKTLQNQIGFKFDFYRPKNETEDLQLEHYKSLELDFIESRDNINQDHAMQSRSQLGASSGMLEKRSKLQTSEQKFQGRATLVSLDRLSVLSNSKKKRDTVVSRTSNSRKSKPDKVGEGITSKVSLQTIMINDYFTNQEPLQFEEDDARVVQKDLENIKNKKVIEIDPEIYQEYNENIQKIENRFRYLVSEEDKYLSVVRPEDRDFLKVNPFRLSDIEIRELKEEMAKKAIDIDAVNWEKVDSLVSRIKFFAKLPKPIRLTLLRNSEYCFFPRGTFVFKQGDYGDLMYVILRGSCNVRIDKITHYGTRENVIVNCLMDGDKFGELAMMGTKTGSKEGQSVDHVTALQKQGKEMKRLSVQRENIVEEGLSQGPQENNFLNEAMKQTNEDIKKSAEEEEKERLGLQVNKHIDQDLLESKIILPKHKQDLENPTKFFERTRRAASIQVAESADMLAIPREKFKDTLLALIQRELEVKLKVLMCIPFFEKLEPFSLIPVANNIVSKTYKMGEMILKEGETPREFCILAQGIVKIVKETIMSRPIHPSNFAKARKPALRNFTFGFQKFSYEDDLERIPEEPKKERVFEDKRTFKYDIVKVDEEKNRLYYKEYVEFATLSRGEFFGGRALLGDEVAKDGFDFEEYLKKIPAAKLSVIADSSAVELYTIDKKQLLYVPDDVKQIFIDGLKLCQDFDDFKVEERMAAMKEWDDMKEAETMDYLKEKHFNRASLQDFKKY